MIVVIFSQTLELDIQSSTPHYHWSKTYIYQGNSFEEDYNSVIDTANFNLMIEYEDDRIIKKTYPRYKSTYHKVEDYKYNEHGELSLVEAEITLRSGRKSWERTRFYRLQNDAVAKYYISKKDTILMEVRRTVNDTTFIDAMVNDEVAFTTKEYWETSDRKHSQVTWPKLNPVSNVYLYNEHGDEIGIERYENDEFIGQTNSVKRFYDSKNRLIRSDIYYGDFLGRQEFILYSD